MSIEVDAHKDPRWPTRVIVNLEKSIPSGCITFWLTEDERTELVEKLKHPMHTVEADKS